MDDGWGVAKRQVDYARQAARLLGWMGDRDVMTTLGESIARIQPSACDELVKDSFTRTRVGAAWMRFAGVRRPTDLDPGTASEFVRGCVRKPNTTAMRRASTLALWVREMTTRRASISDQPLFDGLAPEPGWPDQRRFPTNRYGVNVADVVLQDLAGSDNPLVAAARRRDVTGHGARRCPVGAARVPATHGTRTATESHLHRMGHAVESDPEHATGGSGWNGTGPGARDKTGRLRHRQIGQAI